MWRTRNIRELKAEIRYNLGVVFRRTIAASRVHEITRILANLNTTKDKARFV